MGGLLREKLHRPQRRGAAFGGGPIATFEDQRFVPEIGDLAIATEAMSGEVNQPDPCAKLQDLGTTLAEI
jgi:hypothetical protein